MNLSLSFFKSGLKRDRMSRWVRVGIAALSLPVAFSATEALALTNLKQVQVSPGERVDLLFDAKVNRAQIRTDFLNDTIQLSLNDVSVYPAKISTVSGAEITKIFAYQYAPKLVRCRLTVKGKAEDYKDRLQLDTKGNVLTVRFDNASSDRLKSHSAKAIRPSAATEQDAPAPKDAAQGEKSAKNGMGADEKALLERIMGSAPESAAAKNANRAAGERSADGDSEKKKEESVPAAAKRVDSSKEARSESAPSRKGGVAADSATAKPLATGKPMANPLMIFGKLALVLGVFGLLAFLAKKFLRGGGLGINAGASKGTLGAIRRFAVSKLGQPAKMIEVVSTHHLGPKKSICVVRVAGRLLVLGISNDSINLITQLGEDAQGAVNSGAGAEDGLEDSAEDALALGLGALGFGTGAQAASPRGFAPRGPTFDGILNSEAGRPSMASPVATSPNAGKGQLAGVSPELTNARSRIRNRLEGLKPL